MISNKVFRLPNFRIHMPTMEEYLREVLFGFNGFSYTDDYLTIVGIDDNDVHIVQDYIDSRNPQDEELKFELEQRLLVISNTVTQAIRFGNDLIREFAQENVAMGITQAGKTKDVSDFLIDVLRYAQTGSLYEVINEVNRLEAIGFPVELAPFVTQERMTLFKNKIQSYLGA